MSGVYRTGTVAVTNGSKNVTGAGTSWTANVKQGDQFFLPGQGFSGVVDQITSNTAIVLYDNWGGTTQSGVGYWIAQTSPDWNPIVTFQSDIAAVLASMSGLAAHLSATTNPHVTTLIQALTAMSLSPAADKLAYLTGASSAALADLTAFGRTMLASAGSVPSKGWLDLADGATPDLTTIDSNFVRLLGSTGVTGFAAGDETHRLKWCRLAANKTFTHGATLILPASVPFVGLAGDILLFFWESGTTWRLIAGQRANGNNVVALTAADITDASANGRSLIQAANYAAMWTLLGGGTLGQKAWTGATSVAAGSITAAFATNGTFAPTYALRQVVYHVAADIVFFRLTLVFSANAYSGASGNFKVNLGIPFNAAGLSPVTISRLGKFKPGAAGFVTAEIPAGQAYLNLILNRDNAAVAALGPANVPASGAAFTLYASGFYAK